MSVRKIMLAGVLSVLAAAVLAYGVDYAILRYRVSRNLSPYGSVTVRQYYAVSEKNQRTEYVYGSTQPHSCVNTLFSHMGMAPCWYLRRHSEQEIRI